MTDRPDDRPTTPFDTALLPPAAADDAADTRPTVPLDRAGLDPAAGADVRPAASDLDSTHPAPRVRWAAIVWGLAFAAIAGSLLWVLTGAERRFAVADWFASLSPVTAALVAVLAVGAVLLVAGLAGLARRLSSPRR